MHLQPENIFALLSLRIASGIHFVQKKISSSAFVTCTSTTIHKSSTLYRTELLQDFFLPYHIDISCIGSVTLKKRGQDQRRCYTFKGLQGFVIVANKTLLNSHVLEILTTFTCDLYIRSQSTSLRNLANDCIRRLPYLIKIL